MVWEITAEDLLVRYAAGERNFAGVELIDFYPVFSCVIVVWAELYMRVINCSKVKSLGGVYVILEFNIKI